MLAGGFDIDRIPQASAAPAPSGVMFDVLAAAPWQASGVRLQNGESVRITYVGGQWRAAGGPENNSDPLGSRPGDDRVADPECRFPMPQRASGANALIARIGEDGAPFNPFKTTRTGAGMLYLRLNDCDKYLSDNVGRVRVSIQVGAIARPRPEIATRLPDESQLQRRDLVTPPVAPPLPLELKRRQMPVPAPGEEVEVAQQTQQAAPPVPPPPPLRGQGAPPPIPLREAPVPARPAPGAAPPAPATEVAVPESRAPDAGELADQLASELAKGNIVFNPPSQMRTGWNEQVTVRVSRESVLPAEALSGLLGRGAPQRAQLLTGAFMRVELFGDEGFKITPRGDADQAVPPTGFAEWLFDVLPVSGGERMLTLRVAARYKLPSGEEVRYLPVFTRNISVEVDYWWQTQQFVAANWQYFLSGGGVLVMAVGGYFGKRWVERGGEKTVRRRRRSRA
jgi:hypothetical protein